jgi:hypothetical protein
MKQMWIAGLLALGAMSLTAQPASAWINSKFGVGLNWDWQSGGNNLLWGVWRGGQPPGHDHFAYPAYVPHHHGHHHHGHATFAEPRAPLAQPAPAHAATVPAPATTAAAQNSTYYYQPTYQSVTYPGYAMPTYYYPATYYYYGR